MRYFLIYPQTFKYGTAVCTLVNVLCMRLKKIEIHIIAMNVEWAQTPWHTLIISFILASN